MLACGNSVFLGYDDERGLHADYEKWLEEVYSRLHPAPHVPTSHCRSGDRLHNRTGEACPERSRRNNADAHLKRNATRCELRIMGREVVVAVPNGRLDGSTELAKVFGTWERIFYGEFDGRRRKRVLVEIIGE